VGKRLEEAVGLRIAWCTPFSEQSAIGEFSALIVSALRELAGIEVDIWYPPGAGGRTTPDRGRELDSGSVPALREYDSVVYQMGDHVRYHGMLLAASAQVPGVLVMHDVSLVHLFFPMLIGMTPDELNELFRRLAPDHPEAASDFARDPSAWAWSANTAVSFPLAELAMHDALAVVTHSQFASSMFRNRYLGDISVLPLPILHRPEAHAGGRLPPIDPDRPVVLQAGTLNANKHIDEVIAGFERSKARSVAQLVICGYGPQEEIDRLRRRARHLIAQGDAIVLGAVSDETLDALRRRALVSMVLRHPSTEASSAVLVDSMAYGNAVVAVDAGHYAEMPADILRLVAAPPDPDEIAAMIDSLILNEGAANALGARAAEHVAREHTPREYALGILPILRGAGAVIPRNWLVTEVAEAMIRIGFGADQALGSVVTETAMELFAGTPRRPDALRRNLDDNLATAESSGWS
jgi:glycosyltransferase involved in cell wall biosynthesis